MSYLINIISPKMTKESEGNYFLDKKNNLVAMFGYCGETTNYGDKNKW